MNRILQLTGDGSHTVAIPDLGVTYHSTFGAMRESRHVYIGAGLLTRLDARGGGAPAGGHSAPASVFEMGFGAGLNALLTLHEAVQTGQPVRYEAIELFPLSAAETKGLNYPDPEHLAALHAAPWNTVVPIHPLFTLRKTQASITEALLTDTYDVVYYDAFAPDVQPDLWTEPIYQKLYIALLPGGVLVTYCSKGIVRRGLQEAGFTVEKLPGPPGKREILRAWKK